MNGEWIVYGYKFHKKVHLNLSDRVAFLSFGNYDLVYNVFNFMSKFFNKQNFSDVYLDAGTGIIGNGNKLTGNEFLFFRIPPIVNAVEELKILKKSLLGQLMLHVFSAEEKRFETVMGVFQKEIVQEMNRIMQPYLVRFSCGDEGILNFCKLVGEDIVDKDMKKILPDEAEQFCLKSMLLDIITLLPASKPKLVLLEYPEYGMNEQQIGLFFKKVKECEIDNIMIHTQTRQVQLCCPSIYSYHIVSEKGVCTFDEFGELEKELQLLYPEFNRQEIENEVRNALFEDSLFGKEVKKFILENTNYGSKLPKRNERSNSIL